MCISRNTYKAVNQRIQVIDDKTLKIIYNFASKQSWNPFILLYVKTLLATQFKLKQFKLLSVIDLFHFFIEFVKFLFFLFHLLSQLCFHWFLDQTDALFSVDGQSIFSFPKVIFFLELRP